MSFNLSGSALYRLPDELRVELKKPWGKLIPCCNVSKERILEELGGVKLVVAVGDATSETLGRLGIQPGIYVVDGKEKRGVRQPPTLEVKNEIKVRNPAGFICEEALEAILKALKLEKPVRILVEGEEDLLALVFFATYPPSTVLFYGQPNEGIVVARVGQYREKAAYVLDKMGVPKRLREPLQYDDPFF